MKRVRIAIIGAGSLSEWGIVPVLSSPDAVSPPDSGAWWARRADASSSSEIRYQPPARPEIVAICDTDSARATRLAESARVRAVYSDWRAMLREVECDAVFCVGNSEIAREIALALPANCRLWMDVLPSFSPEDAPILEAQLRARTDKIWCARIARQTSAHRAARQLVERDQIGAPSALALRWSVPFASNLSAHDDPIRVASTYAALDLLSAFAALQSSNRNALLSFFGGEVWARENGGATTLMLQFANEVTATILFCGAETWSAPLPRLEICGTQGRFLVCESGRRLWLHHPREAARFWEPPGLAHHVSSSNVNGLAEDIKEFLAWCAVEAEKTGEMQRHSGASLAQAMSVLPLWDAASRSLQQNRVVSFAPIPSSTRLPPDVKIAPLQPTLSLPL